MNMNIEPMNVLFYGNCQMNGIKQILNLDPNIYNQIVIECFNTETTQENIDYCLKKLDILILQPIQDNYRNKTYLSTTYFIYHCKPSCKIILVNSCFFDFYYFDTKSINLECSVTPYHNVSLYECYKTNKSIEYYIQNYINNTELKSKEELELFASNTLQELDRRYELMLLHKSYSPHRDIDCIYITDYIKNNYKDKLLFYTTNHPTPFVLQYICEHIVSILNIANTIDYESDPFKDTKCLLNICIQKTVHFSIKDHAPLIDGKTSLNDICKLYYQLYCTTDIQL